MFAKIPLQARITVVTNLLIFRRTPATIELLLFDLIYDYSNRLYTLWVTPIIFNRITIRYLSFLEIAHGEARHGTTGSNQASPTAA
jgi:hypothetical protein